MNKMKPCPFCGCKRLRVVDWGVGIRAVCCTRKSCKMFGPDGKTEEEAIAKWNTRKKSKP